MEKEQVLELLQEKARQLVDLEKWLQDNNEKRLAEFVIVQRLVNFKIQDIIDNKPKSEVKMSMYCLHGDLLAGVERARKYQSTTLIDLYSAALDYYHTTYGLLGAYLPKD